MYSNDDRTQALSALVPCVLLYLRPRPALGRADANFSRCNLRGAIFKDADLRHANFYKADLTDATFTHADLAHARFLSAKVDGANMGAIRLDGAEQPSEAQYARLAAHLGTASGVQAASMDAPVMHAMSAVLQPLSSPWVCYGRPATTPSASSVPPTPAARDNARAPRPGTSA
jgi:hypothetical protein